MRLILIRHGQSLGNLNSRFLGHTDMDLSELGYWQAELTADYLKPWRIDAVYASDLLRAYHSVQSIAESRGLEIHKRYNLREIYAGKWENQTYDYLSEHFKEDYSLWKSDIEKAQCTGGENVLELQERVCREIYQIAVENVGRTICIGTHATPIRVFAARCMGQEEIHKIPWVSNASVSVFSFENGTFHVEEYGYDKHLEGFVTKFPKNI